MEEEEEAPATKDSVLDDLSGVPAEVLEAVKGMTLLEAKALLKTLRKFGHPQGSARPR